MDKNSPNPLALSEFENLHKEFLIQQKRLSSMPNAVIDNWLHFETDHKVREKLEQEWKRRGFRLDEHVLDFGDENGTQRI